MAGQALSDPRDPGPGDPGEPGGHAWEATPRGWDVFYAVVFGVDTLVVETSTLPAGDRIAASVALAAMIPWYLAVGRPEILHGKVGNRGWIYLAGAIALFGVVQAQDPNAWFLAFALSAQCFYLAPFRLAMIPIVVLNVLAAVLLVAQDPHRSAVLQAVLTMVFSIGLASVYGAFADRIIAQSLDRAELISQLEATRAELAAAHRESGMLAERQRLAGEIHDTLAQGFSSIVVLLQAAETGLPDDVTAPVRRQVTLAAQTARDNLAEARSLIAALTPADLAGGNLAGALDRITARLQLETGVDAAFEVTGTARPLPAALDVVLLRVGQEALANVRRHAAAASVRVRLAFADGQVSLEVRDDGRGFALSAAAEGYGLRGMRDRLAQVDGRVEVTSQPGTGTTVRAEVPA